MVFFFHSVGTALDTETLLTHPLHSDGTPDLDEGTANHVADCCDEWVSNLSESDWQTFKDATR